MPQKTTSERTIQSGQGLFKSITIRSRLLIGFILIGVLPALLISTASAVIGYFEGRRQAIDRLESVAQLRQFEIEAWLGSVQADLLTLINEPYARDWMEVVLDLAGEHKYYELPGTAIRGRLQLFQRQSDFSEVFLISLEDNIPISSATENEGSIFGWDAAAHPFPSDSTSNQWLVDEKDGSIRMLFIQQVINLDGELLGYLAGFCPLDRLEQIAAERAGLGRTGKTYLVDPVSRLLTSIPDLSSAQTGEGASGQTDLAMQGQYEISPTIQLLIETHQAGSGVYRDHHGRRVLGVYRWVPMLEAGLLVEQDLWEVFGAIMANLGVNLAIVFFVILFAGGAALGVTRSIAMPLENLARTASQISAGELNRKAEIHRHDEIGMLAESFNRMTTQLHDLIDTLESRVEARTRELATLNEALHYRALQLETSAQVSKEVTSILEIKKLLSRVVDLICEAFGYYHVNIYLLNSDKNSLLLQSSSSNLSHFHETLPLDDSSLNSLAARSGKPVVINDVTLDVRFLYDEGLPLTRAELVVPLQVGDAVIGTLDVNADKTNAFRREDILVIQSLGDQIAIAIENLRLYERYRELAVLEERNRLARELHDSVTQSLYSLSLIATGLRKLLQAGETSSLERRLDLIGESAQQSLREMRLLIYELRPPALEKEGLVGALRQRLDAVENRAGLQAHLLVDEFLEFPKETEDALYRITQEALNNAMKHAGAAHVEVRLVTTADRVTLEIQDDGSGFAPDEAGKAGGMGLRNMAERAAAIGAEFSIESGRATGTLVRVKLPPTQPSE